MNKIRIGTRSSLLALWQADFIAKSIMMIDSRINYEIVKISTTGDKITDSPLAKIGGKGLFVKEIEEALLKKKIDIAVHSMKDVPTKLPSELRIVAMTQREDPRDVLVSRRNKKFRELPLNAKIGTSSLRRQAQILSKRKDIKIIPLRGNLDTRLKKIKKEELDGIILAAAGMKRLGFEQDITEYLDPGEFLPAIGQGALGIEARLEDKMINSILSQINHEDTFKAVEAERSFLEKLEGGCQIPIAGYAEVRERTLHLTGLISSEDGKTSIKDSMEGPAENNKMIGLLLADKLLLRGGRAILDSIYRKY